MLHRGCPGVLDHVEIDTNHFMGNFPESAQVHATHSTMVRWLPDQVNDAEAVTRPFLVLRVRG
jgi:allantoicase